MRSVLNGLSVDVEDAFHASAFEHAVPPNRWGRLEQRAEGNVVRLLEMFAQHGVRATFFVLGWMVEHHPEIVRRIAREGHEIACHSYAHRMIVDQTPDELRRDVRKVKQLLEDVTGRPVLGYRAPTFSIMPATAWALDILIEAGFEYDSSIFPVRHDRYGFPGAPRFPYRVLRPGGGTLFELPPSSLRLGRVNVPVAGGGYLRLYPTRVTSLAIRVLNRLEGQPAFVYVHPWDIDPDQPRLPAGSLTWWRHTVSSGRALRKLETLLERFRFGTFLEVIERQEDWQCVRLEDRDNEGSIRPP